MKQTELRLSGAKGMEETPSRRPRQLRLSRKYRALVLSVLTSAVLLWPEAVVWGTGTLRVRQCGEFVAIIDAYHRELGRSPGGSVASEGSGRRSGARRRGKNKRARRVRRSVAARRHKRSLARHARRRGVWTRTAQHQARSRRSHGHTRTSATSGGSSTASGVPQCRLFDGFGAINGCDYRARLDNFAIELQNDPSAQGYIIVYNGVRRTRRNYAQALADKSKDYLISDRGIDASRIVTVDGGRRQELFTELWVVPSGAAPPSATPTVEGDK